MPNCRARIHVLNLRTGREWIGRVSIDAADPAAVLVATDNPCVSAPGAAFVIRGRTARPVLSGSGLNLPYEIVW